jgi:arylsulfatase A-like enzyme
VAVSGIRQFATADEVTNVYLFVADSVRERATSESITSLGVSGRAVAASTYTASSYPSILSGQYPATHRVWGFDDSLADRPALLSGPESFGLHAETIWTDLPPAEKPPFRMVKATATDAMPLTDLEPPFVAVEHHKGGHLPYGYSFAEYDTPGFFEEIRPSLEDLPALYEESVRTAEERFLEAVDHLDDRGLLDETLVIYTSDHGETLGERRNGAVIGHGDPISPDLVSVPIVFAGAGLSDRSLDTALSGVDVAPTALSALGRETRDLDGRDCWTELPTDRLLRSERWVQADTPILGTIDSYKASSVWDGDGGIVFNTGNRLSQLGAAVRRELFIAPWSYLNRHPRRLGHWSALLHKYGANRIRYGDPDFDVESAVSTIEPFRKGDATSTADDIDREQLRKLGYLE